jgi:uncharacterized Fe-S cluster-containing radical SAM superfamily protein
MERSERATKNCASRLSEVSGSFCLAKWLQVTIDLVHGTTHSCHHPKRHLIPLEGLKENPSLLHNTPFKKDQRRAMLAGRRPEECGYCWNIEDTPGAPVSDRIIKSSDPWAWPHFDSVLEAGAHQDIAPTYIEVMFDSACNFSCSYCMADISSSVAREMEKHGAYPVRHKAHRLADPEWKRGVPRGDNPFTEAFWSWLPSIWKGLEVLRVTGGEPLLSKHTFRLLDWVIAHPNPQLTLAFNSNLSVDSNLLEKFKEKLKEVRRLGSVKSIEIYASVDTHGEQAEYIRQGLNYSMFLRELKRVGELCDRPVVMTTFNVLSIPRFHLMIDDMAKMKSVVPNLVLDLSYLREPDYLGPELIDESWHAKIAEDHRYMCSLGCFSLYETDKFKRIVQWISAVRDVSEQSAKRADFYSFIHEYDKRYASNFLQVFPEYRDFLILCKRERFLQSSPK